MKSATVLCAVLWVVILVSSTAADVITLRDGTVLQGKVLEGDEKGLRLQRFDTGGVVFLPWNFLIDRDRDRIRKDRGLDIGELDFLQIPGVRIELMDRTVYEGVIAEQEADKLWLHTSQSRIPIPLKSIVSKETVKVNAVEVYPPAKLYEDKRAQNGEPVDAEAHFELAKFCMQIEYYEKAIEHLGKVQEMDPQFKPDFVQARLAECQSLVANQATVKLFNNLTRLLYANKFTEALDQITALEQLEDLDEVWKNKLAEKKKEAETKRETFFIRSLTSTLPRFIRFVAETASKDRNLSWKNAMNFARRNFSRDLQARLMTRFDLDQKDVRKFLGEIKSYHQIKVSYGPFTWFAPGEKPPRFRKTQSNNNQQGRLSRRSSQNNRNQQQKKRELPKQDELWAKSTSKQRMNYIHAYWAEKSREVHVVRIERRPCTACGGRGTNRITGEGGIIETRCWRCRGVASDRVVVYRIGAGDGQGNVAPASGGAARSDGLTPAQRLRQKLLERKKKREEQGGGRGTDQGGSRRGWSREGARSR
jgi:tetratricopeptide (TPR) repeat protein